MQVIVGISGTGTDGSIWYRCRWEYLVQVQVGVPGADTGVDPVQVQVGVSGRYTGGSICTGAGGVSGRDPGKSFWCSTGGSICAAAGGVSVHVELGVSVQVHVEYLCMYRWEHLVKVQV